MLKFAELGVILIAGLSPEAASVWQEKNGAGGAPCAVLLFSAFFASFGCAEPLDTVALPERANPGMPATRQQKEEEEKAETVVAFEGAQGQAQQAGGPCEEGCERSA